MHTPLTLTSQAGETHTLQVPTTWGAVTLDQFISWQTSDEPAVVCLAGISAEQLDRLNASDAQYLLNLLAFAVELPDPPITPGLRDVGEASYGQMVLATQYLQNNPDRPTIWYAPYLYALYRSREAKGGHDPAHIAELETWVRAQPVDVVLSDVLFTAAAWLISWRATLPEPMKPTNRTMTSWRQALSSCTRALGRYFKSTPLPNPSA